MSKLANMSAVLLWVLVLLSTLGQAPHELKCSCTSKGIAMTCSDTAPPRTTAPPSQTRQHSLISSVHFHVSLMFFFFILCQLQPRSLAELVCYFSLEWQPGLLSSHRGLCVLQLSPWSTAQSLIYHSPSTRTVQLSRTLHHFLSD